MSLQEFSFLDFVENDEGSVSTKRNDRPFEVEWSISPDNNNSNDDNDDDDDVTKYLALDCEMVGIDRHGVQSALARVSIVDFNGEIVLDTLVHPGDRVTDYRTEITGLTANSFRRARIFSSVQNQVKQIINGKIVIGHSLYFDFRTLRLQHPRELTRDTSLYQLFLDLFPNRQTPSLKRLAERTLKKTIQEGVHDSVTDAQTAMEIYRKYQTEWEHWIEVNGAQAMYTGVNYGCFICYSEDHVKKNCPNRMRNGIRQWG
ncbi:hypothetical protein G9A89_001563 [Geosiphon pyriformis]|nr:hypothetical protein G9A89_001563 [Geosiphon pyriformis]